MRGGGYRERRVGWETRGKRVTEREREKEHRMSESGDG